MRPGAPPAGSGSCRPIASRCCARASTRTSTRRRTRPTCCRRRASCGRRRRSTTARMSAVDLRERSFGRLSRATRARAVSGPDRRARVRWGLAVLAVMAGRLAPRLWGIHHGMPYAYNADENAHFVPGAIGLFGHGWNPNYFVNPPAYTYLLHVVFADWFGGRAGVSHAYATHPTEVFVVARATAAVVGTVAVWFVYLTGARLFDRRTGLLAGALLAVAFLPVFYSHLALNDVPTLAPIGLSLWGTAGVLRRGRVLDYLVAGAGLGLACATKYTGGGALLPPPRAGAGSSWPAPSPLRHSSSPTRTRSRTSRRSATAKPPRPARPQTP